MSIKELATAVKKVDKDDDDSEAEFLDKYQDNYQSIIKKISDADWLDCQDFLCACVRSGVYKLVDEFGLKLLERKKQINWKKHPEMMHKLFDAILEIGVRDDIEDSYSSFVEAMINICQHYKMLDKYQDRVLEVLCCALTNKDGPLQLGSIQCAVAYPWKTQSQGCKTVLSHLLEAVQANPTLTSDTTYYTSCETTLTLLFTSLYNTPKIGALTDKVKELMQVCKELPWTDDESDEHTLSWMMLNTALNNYVQMNSMDAKILKSFIPIVKELWECDDDDLQSTANDIMTSLGQHSDLLADDDTDAIIQLFLSGQEPNLITQFTQMYPKHPEKFHAHFDELVDCLENMNAWMKLSAIQFFWEMSKKNAQIFTKHGIKVIAETLHIKEARLLTLLVLVALAEKRPDDVIMYDDDAMRVMEEDPNAAASGIGFLVHLAKGNKTRTKKYISFVVKLVPKTQSIYQTSLMHNMRIMGQPYPELLAEQKPFINKMMKEPGLKDMCQMMIDVIEGRSLEGLSEEVAVQRDDIDQLDERVGTTEENVENLGKEVDEQKDKLVKVREDVDKAEERIDDLEVVVEETVEKVEEIDKKTLSHAPRWSRDVSYLLNPEDEHDWRLLARRLGYSADDVRNWATQPDPCMSMLDEWFATHKTSEATHAVLKSLEEMDRMDAAEIVGRALASVEDVVEEPPELSELPSIFISYQWGYQDEVKLLKKHLGTAGYDAWMDIGQMGGGDKLFAKIDEGIRAAKVVICCVTEKYAKSANCNREVTLSTTLGKPVIPLLMEKMQWPPPGAMGPIFGEYLFIRFFQRGDGEKTGDGRYWPVPKFQELLMQLRYSIPPDEAIVDKPYKGWWDPPEEVITIKPREQKGKSGPVIKEQKPSNSSPEIFISYQWGKQPQIKALYKRLTSLGYNCWFDIMQMGGGDSLYDKIDKGVRGCDVMLSCVTTKYSKSANCRREVSLADAIKKPIIPLLLEGMTWPPEGPMSMVFTQLLYINFCKPSEDIQDHWECNQFGELQEKVAGYLKGEESLPSPPRDKPSVEQTVKPSKENDGTNTSKKPQSANGQPENTSNVESKHEMKSGNTSSSSENVFTTTKAPDVVAPSSSCCAIM